MQDLENAGPNTFAIHWTTNSYQTVVLIQTAYKRKKSKIVMQKVNPCAQKNEILVHKGHKRKKWTVNSHAVSVTFESRPILLLIILKKWKFYVRTVTSNSVVICQLWCTRVCHFPALLFQSLFFFDPPFLSPANSAPPFWPVTRPGPARPYKARWPGDPFSTLLCRY